jgi:hypothetical protein
MTMIDINCWERGCACYDSRIADETVEVLLAKQEQGEPVAWEYCEEVFWHTNQNLNDYICANGTPLYTTPQQRTWVGLTHEEREEIALEVPMDAVCITEAKLRSKNERL